MSSLTSPPDTPCIGVCSTAIGDDVCLGCARTFAEISFWAEMSEAQKAASWARLPVRRVWLAVVKPLQGHLDIAGQGDSEQARFTLPDGRHLLLGQPYLQDGRRLLPLSCAGRQTLLEVSLPSWPQQLHAFMASVAQGQ
ncbi:MAG: DUF1289 domain-containing protein [Vogesella sp.]|uniref:DUF1289 domain-containing protein n=1 Tax=Vogesella sp. TaxID=1904252 RepID=UPI00391D530F